MAGINVEPFKTFYRGLPTEQARIEFAERCQTTTGYITQIMYGNRNCGAVLAIAIERESNGAVRCDDLCPDADFTYLRNSNITDQTKTPAVT